MVIMIDDKELSGSLDIPTTAHTCSDFLGMRRAFLGLDFADWAFLSLSCVNIFVVIGLTIERLVSTWDDPKSLDFTYALLLLINALFCLFYVFNGVLRERQFEIYAFIAAEVLVVIYCILEYTMNTAHRNEIKLVRLIMGCVLTPVNIALALYVAFQFGWLEFRIVGASVPLQNMFRQLCLFLSLQRFDLQVAISFLILVMKHPSALELEETLTSVIGLPLLIISFFIGFFAVQAEQRSMVIFFGFLSLILPAFIVYKFFELSILQADITSCARSLTMVCIFYYSIVIFGYVAFLSRCIMLIELYFVYKNFGYGLKERAFAALVDSENTSLLGRQRRRR